MPLTLRPGVYWLKLDRHEVCALHKSDLFAILAQLKIELILDRAASVWLRLEDWIYHHYHLVWNHALHISWHIAQVRASQTHVHCHCSKRRNSFILGSILPNSMDHGTAYCVNYAWTLWTMQALDQSKQLKFCLSMERKCDRRTCLQLDASTLSEDRAQSWAHLAGNLFAIFVGHVKRHFSKIIVL